MRRFFDDDARASSRAKGDTEFTLGSGMLLGVFFGLVVLCGFCFGMGYVLGNRGSNGPVFQSQPPAAGPSPQFTGNTPQGKPPAAEQPPQTPAQPMTGNQATAAAPGTAAATVPGAAQQAQGAAPGAPPTTAAVTPAVNPNDGGWRATHPALPGGAGAVPATQPISANRMQPAASGQGALMVQVAALSNQQDAGVLMGALRQRGYTVSAMRYPADNLIHVCVGPFNNALDANSMKQKLLSDGYNAVILVSSAAQ